MKISRAEQLAIQEVLAYRQTLEMQTGVPALRHELERLVYQWRQAAETEARKATAAKRRLRACADELEAVLGGVGAGRIAEARETETKNDEKTQARGESTDG